MAFKNLKKIPWKIFNEYVFLFRNRTNRVEKNKTLLTISKIEGILIFSSIHLYASKISFRIQRKYRSALVYSFFFSWNLKQYKKNLNYVPIPFYFLLFRRKRVDNNIFKYIVYELFASFFVSYFSILIVPSLFLSANTLEAPKVPPHSLRTCISPSKNTKRQKKTQIVENLLHVCFLFFPYQNNKQTKLTNSHFLLPYSTSITVDPFYLIFSQAVQKTKYYWAFLKSRSFNIYNKKKKNLWALNNDFFKPYLFQLCYKFLRELKNRELLNLNYLQNMFFSSLILQLKTIYVNFKRDSSLKKSLLRQGIEFEENPEEHCYIRKDGKSFFTTVLSGFDKKILTKHRIDANKVKKNRNFLQKKIKHTFFLFLFEPHYESKRDKNDYGKYPGSHFYDVIAAVFQNFQRTFWFFFSYKIVKTNRKRFDQWYKNVSLCQSYIRKKNASNMSKVVIQDSHFETLFSSVLLWSSIESKLISFTLKKQHIFCKSRLKTKKISFIKVFRFKFLIFLFGITSCKNSKNQLILKDTEKKLTLLANFISFIQIIGKRSKKRVQESENSYRNNRIFLQNFSTLIIKKKAKTSLFFSFLSKYEIRKNIFPAPVLPFARTSSLSSLTSSAVCRVPVEWPLTLPSTPSIALLSLTPQLLRKGSDASPLRGKGACKAGDASAHPIYNSSSFDLLASQALPSSTPCPSPGGARARLAKLASKERKISKRGDSNGGELTPYIIFFKPLGIRKRKVGVTITKTRYGQKKEPGKNEQKLWVKRLQRKATDASSEMSLLQIGEQKGLKEAKKSVLKHQKNKKYNFLGYEINLFLKNKTNMISDHKSAFQYYLIPSKERIRTHLQEMGYIVKIAKSQTQEDLIFILALKIREWSIYYQNVSTKKIFNYCDYLTLKMIWKWACRKHPKKSRQWVKCKYFVSLNGKNWVFCIYQQVKSHYLCLPYHTDICLFQHNTVEDRKSPYDGDIQYWSYRLFNLTKDGSI